MTAACWAQRTSELIVSFAPVSIEISSPFANPLMEASSKFLSELTVWFATPRRYANLKVYFGWQAEPGRINNTTDPAGFMRYQEIDTTSEMITQIVGIYSGRRFRLPPHRRLPGASKLIIEGIFS